MKWALIQQAMGWFVILTTSWSNGSLPRGGMCDRDLYNLVGIGNDNVMLSSYDCWVEEVEVDAHFFLLTSFYIFLFSFIYLFIFHYHNPSRVFYFHRNGGKFILFTILFFRVSFQLPHCYHADVVFTTYQRHV